MCVKSGMIFEDFEKINLHNNMPTYMYTYLVIYKKEHFSFFFGICQLKDLCVLIPM
jgi:hypothetical protein